MLITFDLTIPYMKYEFQLEKTKLSALWPLNADATSLTFDSNTKFYFCSDKVGTTNRACTVSKVIFEYRYYGADGLVYGHLAGDRILICRNSSL